MKQSIIFKPTLKFSQETSVSNVNVSNDNFLLSQASTPYTYNSVVKIGTTQIIRRGHIHLKNNHNIIIIIIIIL